MVPQRRGIDLVGPGPADKLDLAGAAEANMPTVALRHGETGQQREPERRGGRGERAGAVATGPRGAGRPRPGLDPACAEV